MNLRLYPVEASSIKTIYIGAGVRMQECEYMTILAINALLSLLPQNFSLCETQYALIN